jgi:hypothetical protein
MAFDPDKFISEPDPIKPKKEFDPDEFLKEENESGAFNVTPGAAVASTAAGALVGSKLGSMADNAKLNRISIPIPPVQSIGPGPVPPVAIPKPVIPPAPAKPILPSIGTSTPGVSPGQAYSAATGYGSGPGYTVEDVVEHKKAQNAPIGGGKVAKNITGPLNVQGIMDQISLQSDQKQNMDMVRQQQAQHRAELQKAREDLLNQYNREKAAHAQEVNRLNQEHATATQKQKLSHEYDQKEHKAKQEQHVADVNKRNEAVYQQELQKQAHQNRPLYQKKGLRGGVLGGIIGLATSPLVEQGYNYLFNKEPEGHAGGGSIGSNMLNDYTGAVMGGLSRVQNSPIVKKTMGVGNKGLQGLGLLSAMEIPHDIEKGNYVDAGVNTANTLASGAAMAPKMAGKIGMAGMSKLFAPLAIYDALKPGTLNEGEDAQIKLMHALQDKKLRDEARQSVVFKHAEGGPIQGYSKGKQVQNITNSIKGYLHHTDINPNPLVGTRYKTTDLGGLIMPYEFDPAKYMGAKILHRPYDLSSRNYRVDEVSGHKLINPIITEGGQGFGRDIYNQSIGLGGASQKEINDRILKRVDAASREGSAERGGSGRVLNIPSSMGYGSEAFSTMPINVQLDLLKQRQFSPEIIKKLNNQVQSFHPKLQNFVGFDDPRLQQQILTGGFDLGTTPGQLRKAITGRLGTKENQKLLDYNAEDLYHALRDPDLRNTPAGYMGLNVMESQPFHRGFNFGNHSAYNSGDASKFVGQGVNAPVSLWMPDSYRDALSKIKAAPKTANANPNEQRAMARNILSSQESGVAQTMNQQVVDNLGRYKEAVKSDKINPNSLDDIHKFIYGNKSGDYAEGGSIQGYAGGKSVSQLPKVAQALEHYLKGNISNAERINIMNQHLPIRKWSGLPPNATDEEIRNALMSNKQPLALAEVPAGMRVGNRLDIPAYTQNGVYVDTVHDINNKNKAVSYNRTGHLTDVDFSSLPNSAVRMGLGTAEQALTPLGAEIGKSKAPIAMIKGTNVGTHDDEVRRMMAEYLNDPKWTQIGMDPRRHSQFYDKSTGMPVWSAEQKLQSGPLVMVPKQGLESTHWEDPRLELKDFPKKHYAGGGLAELAKKLLPLAQRETNKAKAFANRHLDVPDVMYHGTSADINQFVPKQANATFLSPTPRFAQDFSDSSENYLANNFLRKLKVEDPGKFELLKKDAVRIANKSGSSWGDELETLARNQLTTRANTMPVHVNATNPFDYENQKHLDALRLNLAKNADVRDAYKQVNNLMGGNWSEIESPAVQQAIKNMGHDSFWVREGGQKNLGIYDPKQIKSAIGNQGTYDFTNPDITKAEGGLMHLAGGGEAWQRSEGKNPEGGLNAKGRASYNKAHGAHLKAPQPEGGSRKDSFCARMTGMKKKLTSSETANDPDSRINKALRKWKC